MPEYYLSPNFISAHLKLFENGGTAFTRNSDNINRFGQFGRNDGAFVFSTEYAQKMIEVCNGAPKKLEQLLGLNPESIGDNLIRIDIESENMKDLRMPSGNEDGSSKNSQWRSGGDTYSGGIPEAVINPVKPDNLTISTAFVGK